MVSDGGICFSYNLTPRFVGIFFFSSLVSVHFMIASLGWIHSKLHACWPTFGCRGMSFEVGGWWICGRRTSGEPVEDQGEEKSQIKQLSRWNCK